MNAVAAAYKNELAKILWRPKYRVMIAVYAFISLGSGLFGASGFSVRVLRELAYNVTGPNVVYGALSLYRSLLLPLAIFMLAADVFTHELESKSIKCVLTRPVSRFDAFLAKCLAILCYTAIALCVGFIIAQAWQIITAIIGGSGGGNGAGAGTGVGTGAGAGAGAGLGAGGANPASPALPGMFDGPPSTTPSRFSFYRQAGAIAEAFASYALTLVPIAAFIAFASFVAVAFRSPALVMFICIAAYCALSVISVLYNGASAALFTSYTGWYRMWFGDRLPWRSILIAAGIMISTCVAFFGFGYFIFDRKDI
jgi:ABC-2 type transport system permease protein